MIGKEENAMSFEIVKGKLYDAFIADKSVFNEIESKILSNIKKVAIDASKVKLYLLDHFLYQTRANDQLMSSGFNKDTWYLSSLETGFYQLATNLLFNLYSEKKLKQVSIDYILGQLIENAKMKKITNVLNSEEIIKKLEELRLGFFDAKTVGFLSGLKVLRDENASHHDINFSHPEVIKIKEVYELFYKMNNTLVSLLEYLEISSDAISRYEDKQFLWEINNYLIKNGIYK
jgi:hypothetical protein